jgi:predicted Rossmann fold flavoprotein
MGHTIVVPVPSAVPLTVKSPLCHAAQGQRIGVKLKAVVSGNIVSESSGDLLFTKYGLSGTAALDVSREISIALNRDGSKDVFLSADLAPFMEESELAENIENAVMSGRPVEYLLAGVVPIKISISLGRAFSGYSPSEMAAALKSMKFDVTGTRGWNEAEFTAGGVNTDEINPMTLESKFRKGLYFAGEVLDVDGRRGGYNLAWAWASGYIAGKRHER